VELEPLAQAQMELELLFAKLGNIVLRTWAPQLPRNSLLAAKCVPTVVLVEADEADEDEDARDDVDLVFEDAACASGPALRKHAHG